MSRSRLLFFLLLIAISASAFTSLRNVQHSAALVSKKGLILLKEGDYAKNWAIVDSLDKKGLPLSAIEEVKKIYAMAQTDKNGPQIIKSMLYIMKYNSTLQEDDYVVALNDLNKMADESVAPQKQMIHSIIAEVYWGYYQSNRWKFLNRTQTVEFKNEDIRTWDLTKLSGTILKHYLLSLTDDAITKSISIASFEDILYDYQNTRDLRPSVYDFLAHRALDFLKSTEFDVTKPSYTFRLDKPEFFGTGDLFTKTLVINKDTLSAKFFATRIFQELEKFHADDKDPAAQITLEIERLNFVKTYSTLPNKDTLYYAALQNLKRKHSQHPSVTEVHYEIAKVHRDIGNLYNPLISDEYKNEKNNALAICEENIAKFPKSYGTSLLQSLKSEILAKSLTMQMEDVVSVNKASKVLVSSKNVDKIYFRIIKPGWDFEDRQNYNSTEEYLEKIMAYQPIQQWEQNLKDDNDHQLHRMEINIPALPAGYYIIIAGSDKNFKTQDHSVWYGGFGVSDISYADRRNWEDESIEITVMDRNNGSPMPNTKAQIYYKEYNYRTSKYILKKAEVYTSDANGQFTIKATNKDYRYLFIDFTTTTDRLNSDQSFYQYRRYNDDYERTTTYFFTDRSIYRPGQTIHFKGIRISTDSKGENSKLKPNEPVYVQFFDPNYQKISEVTLTTNEYGSFAGTFTAPQGVLNGSMRITDNYGTKYISVEEYKRPKFEVAFEPVKGVYRLGQKIKVKGTAKAYAGATVDGAKVQYRVTRNMYFPYSWYGNYWYYSGRPNTGAMEITFGETNSNEKGEFEIFFDAISDQSVDRKYQPAFSYTVTADVTDINGETHSTTTTINVGYTSMTVSNGIPVELFKSANQKFPVYANNLNYHPVNAKGNVSIYKVKQPDQVFISRKWEQPDRHNLSRDEYYKTFPGQLYANENDHTKWPREKKVFEFSFNTEKKDSIQLKNLKDWEEGKYVIEMIALDSFGVEVKDIKYIDVIDEKSTKMAFTSPFEIRQIKTSCEPGEKASFLISSAYPNTKILYEVEEKNKIVSRNWISLNNEQKLIEIPIEEKHRGNFSVHFLMVQNGRLYHQDLSIYVPHTNKMLDVEFETFRNKLLPGQKEEWKMKVKGKKGEKVAAELLLTMYDASLDVFAPNSFHFWPHISYGSSRYWGNGFGFSQKTAQNYQDDWNNYYSAQGRYFDRLEWFGYQVYYYGGYYRYSGYYEGDEEYADDNDVRREGKSYSRAPMKDSKVAESEKSVSATTVVDALEVTGGVKKNDAGVLMPNEQERLKENNNNEISGETGKEKDKHDKIQLRTNLSETAFFFPQLETDENGDIIVKFTAPEALTRWKILGLAHTTDLKTTTFQKELITQKELMLLPNVPRFFREGDKIFFAAKISNVSEKDLSGTAQLLLFESTTMKAVDVEFKNKKVQQEFSVKKGLSTLVTWELEIPDGIGAVTYRITAKANEFSDGEEMAIPVLTNRMLVTESMPLPIRKAGTKTFTLDKLVNSNKSGTLKNHKLTLEFTNNPAWYAIQAMPYIMEYPYECAEQTFSRFYANSIASHVVNSSPKIKAVFDNWKSNSPEAFMSNLEKNEELKSLMLEETPWVLDAKNESERKKRVALLFDLNKMSNELTRALTKLKKMQVSNGAWPWFPGMPESRYITQHIVTGMGHLDKLGVKNVREEKSTWNMVTDAVGYLDREVVKDYEYIKKHYPEYKKNNHLSYEVIQFIYARSYFRDIPIHAKLKEALLYYEEQSNKYWLEFGLYAQGMLALGANRFEQKALAADIVKSIREKAIRNEEMGMYWKDNVVGYYWYQAPIETHALMIELFDEVANDQETVEELKVWLLKNKQTSDWKTTKATADACYALLLRGVTIIDNDEIVEIKLGDKIIDPKKMDVKVEAGTGYFKTSWSGTEITSDMGKVTLTKKTDGVSWGAIYWQYFEQLDKITPAETPLKLNKKLFLVKNTVTGPVISPLTDNTKLAPGDKVRVRIELRVDRSMNYVHMKDMRASCFEPINVFSRYKWQDGLGYYESTRDAATNFFFEYLPKGTHVFEYDLMVAQLGDFSNGITSIQCMYAPEFTSHSEGVRVKVSGKE